MFMIPMSEFGYIQLNCDFSLHGPEEVKLPLTKGYHKPEAIRTFLGIEFIVISCVLLTWSEGRRMVKQRATPKETNSSFRHHP